MQRRTVTTWALAGVAALALGPGALLAQGRGRGNGGVPPGHRPAAGECRVWYDGRPPGHQPAPTSCDAARAEAYRTGGRVVYGGRRDDRRDDDRRYDDRRGRGRYEDRRDRRRADGRYDGRDDGRGRDAGRDGRPVWDPDVWARSRRDDRDRRRERDRRDGGERPPRGW
jgi:hypothetical protein